MPIKKQAHSNGAARGPAAARFEEKKTRKKICRKSIFNAEIFVFGGAH
jgi:hypothetical protein